MVLAEVPTTRVIVTRPAREGAQWVQALQQRGIAAQALALIAIGPAPDAAALQAVRTRVLDYRAIMVVSGNAAQHFFDPKTALALAHQTPEAIKTRVWSPGPGTADTLLALGVPAACVDRPAADAAQFDSEALWAQVQDDVGAGERVLVVRGAEADALPKAQAANGWPSNCARAAQMSILSWPIPAPRRC